MTGESSQWLEAQCRAIAGASRGLLVLGKAPQGPFAPAAAWPAEEGAPPSDLVGAAQIAISTARPALRGVACATGEVSRDVVAVPIFDGNAPTGAVAVRVVSQTGRPAQAVADLLEGALRDLKLAEPAPGPEFGRAPAFELPPPPTAAPEPAPKPAPEPEPGTKPVAKPAPKPPTAPPVIRFRPPPSAARSGSPAASSSIEPPPPPDPARALLDLTVAAIDCAEFGAAAIALVTDLATRLRCERVSLGFVEGGEVELAALSHSARFDARTKLARDIAAAMEEAVDQEAVVAYPPLTSEALEVAAAHAALCEAHGSAAAYTVPLVDGEEIVGALSFEMSPGSAPRPEDVAFAEQAAVLLGPILELKRLDARPVWRVIWDSIREQGRVWLDPERAGRRWLAGAGVALTLLLCVVPGTHRVSAPATLEGTVQRAIVASIDGYIAESRARAGDVVKRGDVLGALDGTDLELERRKWASRREQIDKEFRAAGAENDRSQLRILRARLDEADAEIALLDGKLARIHLKAPFDGVVTEGDLSQSLGSPVKRGDVLFEVAPLESYRIVLEVDEREIAEVAPGQSGELTLSALPGRTLPMRVERITPLASSEEGRNFFRAEAELMTPSAPLRPGMEGIAKIEIGRRSLIWIWTHRLFDWLRLAAWSWLP